MEIAEVLQLCTTYGFPVVMCFYLIIRLEGIINENTKALQELRELILVRSKKDDDC